MVATQRYAHYTYSVYTTTTLDHLYSLLVRPGAPDAIVLLGAGASVKSGIPLSATLVERAAKWAYCRDSGRRIDDPTVVRSDWLPWLQNHGWYHADKGPADNYSGVIEHLLQPREERKQFFIDLIRPGVPPSSGYQRLVDLMADDAIRTVLTTNFDEVLPDLCRTRNRPHHVEVIKTQADYTKYSAFPTHPQILYLHGSVEHYSDKNLLNEVQRLDDELVRHLGYLLRDHPLVVIGYRGAEESVMRHLLMNQAHAANDYRHGIFWCARPGSALHPLVQELANTIHGNFQLVPIEGFDELFGSIWARYEREPSRPRLLASHHEGGAVESSPTWDMQPLLETSLDDVEWSLIQSQLPAYCRRMDIRVPAHPDRQWFVDRLCDLDLAVSREGYIHLSRAGYLLFARRPNDRVRAAQVVLRVGGEPVRTLDGNLWRQLDGVMEVLEELNRPFRLKGAISETVHPYPPLALKELVVNALVHRSYEHNERVIVEVEPSHIRITNPGGLVGDVLRQVRPPAENLQDRIERGGRGIKGYRNPVVADIFYGAGAMDKAGSGLADVQGWVQENEGSVTFGPTANNLAFDVTVYRRQEQVDPVTRTAAPLVVTARFTSNLLEVVEVPPTVWTASTDARRPREIWQATKADWIPPFVVHGGLLLAFADLTDPANPLRGQIEPGTAEPISFAEFAIDADRERLLVWLLNESLYRYLGALGLIVDKERKRAYFPRSETGPREVTYQATLRRATRTVTKPVVSKTTDKVRYWEHQGFHFGFEKYAEVWTLQILPCYVFTVDGGRRLIEGGARVASLATRRAARDYNPQVHGDLVFWTWVLARGQDTIELHAGPESMVRLRSGFTTCEVRDVVPEADIAEPEPDARVQAEEADLLEELAGLADASRPDDDPQGEPDATHH